MRVDGYLIYDAAQNSIQLTEKSWPVLFGDERIYVSGIAPKISSSNKPISQINLSDEFNIRMTALIDGRKRAADIAGISPYQILSDRTLERILSYSPQSPKELTSIQGVDFAKIPHDTDEIIDIILSPFIANHKDNNTEVGLSEFSLF